MDLAFFLEIRRLDARRVLLQNGVGEPLGALALEFPFDIRAFIIVYYFFHIFQSSLVGILVVLLFLFPHDVGILQLRFSIDVFRDTRAHAQKYKFSISKS